MNRIDPQDMLDRAVLGLVEHAPGATACITDERHTVALTTSGLRRADRADPLTPAHAMHIGSCAKSMTATMVARAVDLGIVSWSEPALDHLPGEIDPAFARVSLVDLLSHRSGLPPLEDDTEIDRLPAFAGDAVDQRAGLTAHLLEAGPAGQVGEFRYSNAGFAVAVSVVERATGWRWEEEMPKMFDRLGMDAGIGWAPADHAWGHRLEGDRFAPIDPAGDYQIEPWLAVAGDVHATPESLGVWLRENLAGLDGGTSLLSARSWSRLHGLGGDGFGLGWGRQEFRGRPVSVHSGSAETFYTLMLIDHGSRLGIAICLNAATRGAQEAAIDVLREAVDHFAA